MLDPVIVGGSNGVGTLDVTHKATAVGAACVCLILDGEHGVGMGNSCNGVRSAPRGSPDGGSPKLVATQLLWTGGSLLLTVSFVSVRAVMAAVKAPPSHS